MFNIGDIVLVTGKYIGKESVLWVAGMDQMVGGSYKIVETNGGRKMARLEKNNRIKFWFNIESLKLLGDYEIEESD